MLRSRAALAAALAVSLDGVAQVPLDVAGAAGEVRGRWRIEQARIEPVYDKTQARLDFGADGRLTGHTGCNPLAATYTLDGSRLTLGTVAAGRAACGRLQREQDDRILSALEVAVSARVRSDGLLELRDAEGRGVLRATRPGDGD